MPRERHIDEDFWRGRRVFVTGHTGFKGSWLACWLSRLGAVVAGYALPPATSPSLFEDARVEDEIRSVFGDVRDLASLRAAVDEHRPEVVFHLAAQALVRESYVDAKATFEVNVLGTVNLLEALRGCATVRAALVVTSDKCYENRGWVWPYRESDPLGGHDPYSASKACAELVTRSYRDSFFSGGDVGVASARAGNVLGGGDWAPDRLVPDVVRSLLEGAPLVLRYPDAIRPWQHVLDPLAGYLMLAQSLWNDPELAGPWNFAPSGDEVKTVGEIVDRLAELLDRDAQWTRQVGEVPHEAGTLSLDASKARRRLGWKPRFPLDETLAAVAEWYLGYAAGRSGRELVEADLDRFARPVHS